jgi:hypothetical protein
MIVVVAVTMIVNRGLAWLAAMILGGRRVIVPVVGGRRRMIVSGRRVVVFMPMVRIVPVVVAARLVNVAGDVGVIVHRFAQLFSSAPGQGYRPSPVAGFGS